VSWTPPKDVAIDKLREGLRKAGLSEKLAPDMSKRNALSRALQEMKKGRVIRELRKEEKWLYFQLTAESISETEATYTKEAELKLDVETGAVFCIKDEIRIKAQASLNEHLHKRLARDVTSLVQRVYDDESADLIPIRDAGGAYFVPDLHADLVNKTKILLLEIDGKLNQWSVRLGHSDTDATLAESMSDYMIGLVKEFKESIDSLSSESRSDVKDRRQGRIREIRQKLECYRGIMAGFADKIGEEIDAADQELLTKLSALPIPEAA
jgi:hypothetical protein